MANLHDDKFAAFASVRTTDGVPYRLTLSTTAATISSLPIGRYIVVTDASVVYLRTGGTAAVPSSGSAATGDTIAVQTGWTYRHSATADLSAVLISGSAELTLQPVPPPG